ncbi:M20 metallopeptidase family protein [Clostridium luticellarii]|jgi:amidohydrolase|uniref:Putative hydrolase YxeP n=1 Tax=Clostridium luticellarii TaxID=1691940 RepID=A0A2T0BNM4_9CLOT|nr:amidohydrolase [Clostridium luticellarii]MCI1944385.1 amidohydrolase [Clostridium luticellarii]MCI1967505.1 amidohydrolase [Clostridium luticellarii]MCI1995017.1 amidohydrolase [Clostridium luticellarii]MCI2039544.1 amidohydrolase [Clostridium luticellarii]PRR85466.1 putative hydrolase YxeP [Clostridium luticellarii]
MSTLDKAREIKPWMVELRRDFHMHPEPSFEEVRTSKIIDEKLREIGIKTTSTGKTGVIGILQGEKPGKVIGLRADIDALSVREDTGLPYSSKNPGYMHACGHDTHITELLGAARILSGLKDKLAGSVKFIFQPAEEAGTGAEYMVEHGALENPKVDMIVGMHTFGLIETGKVVVQKGALMASIDVWNLTIEGKSCHGSSPWQGVDAMPCAVAVMEGFQTIVSRFNDVRNPIVINVGTVKAGERFNVVPGKVEMTGSNRAFSEDSRKMLPKWMKQMVDNVCSAYGCKAEFKYEKSCSPVINEAVSTELVKKSVARVIGEENVIQIPPVMGSEDFSTYLEKVPGTFMILGGGNSEKGWTYSQHSNHFIIDEDCLVVGASVYAQTALDFLQS